MDLRGNLRPREGGRKSGPSAWGGGFRKANDYAACGSRKANFFFRRNRRFSEPSRLDGKRNPSGEFLPSPLSEPDLLSEPQPRIPTMPDRVPFMTRLLLPCECSADVAVTAGQAGGQRRLSRAAAARVDVPRLRDLAAAGQPTRRGRTRPRLAHAARGLLLAGRSMAPSPAVAALTVGRIAAWFFRSLPDATPIRAAVLSRAPSTIYSRLAVARGVGRAAARPPTTSGRSGSAPPSAGGVVLARWAWRASEPAVAAACGLLSGHAAAVRPGGASMKAAFIDRHRSAPR